MSKIIEPPGFHVTIEIAGEQFVRYGIDTIEFAREVFEAACDHCDHAWLHHGGEQRSAARGSLIEEHARTIIKAG